MEWPIEGIDPESKHRGEYTSWKKYLGFTDTGNIKLELIQPIEGDTLLNNFSKTRPWASSFTFYGQGF